MSGDVPIEEFIKKIVEQYPVYMTQRLESYVRQKARDQANFSQKQQEEFKKANKIIDIGFGDWETQEVITISKIHIKNKQYKDFIY